MRIIAANLLIIRGKPLWQSRLDHRLWIVQAQVLQNANARYAGAPGNVRGASEIRIWRHIAEV